MFIFDSLFSLSRMFMVKIMKTLSVSSVVYCSAISFPTILGETADLGGRVDGAVFSLLSLETEAPFAKPLIIMDVILFLQVAFKFFTLLALIIYVHDIRFAKYEIQGIMVS
jgi:hypothetical protein